MTEIFAYYYQRTNGKCYEKYKISHRNKYKSSNKINANSLLVSFLIKSFYSFKETDPPGYNYSVILFLTALFPFLQYYCPL